MPGLYLTSRVPLCKFFNDALLSGWVSPLVKVHDFFEWSTDPVPTGIKVPYPIAFQLDSNTEGMSFHICARVQEYDYHDQSPNGMAG